MKELVKATGFPRTTIHHYLREGLLPAPHKTARNSAEYGAAHVARLRLIAALRAEWGAPPSVSEIRATVALIDAGVEPGVAAALRRMELPESSGGARRITRSELARSAGLNAEALEALLAAGLLAAGVGTGTAESFGPTEVAVCRSYASLLHEFGFAVSDLAPMAVLFREAAAYEGALMRLALADVDPADAPGRGRRLGEALQAMERYLIAAERAGVAETPGESSPS